MTSYRRAASSIGLLAVAGLVAGIGASSLLVSAATHIMRRYAPDSDLRRFGRRVEGPSPTPRARGRARIAVARKLAVRLYWKLRKQPSPVPPARTQGNPENSLVDVSPS